MNYTIEQEFFEVFGEDGILDSAIKWICIKRGLCYDYEKLNLIAKDLSFSQSILVAPIDKGVVRTLEKKIEKGYKDIDNFRKLFSRNDWYTPLDCPIMVEIEKNIIEIKDNPIALEQYINFILLHFRELSNICFGETRLNIVRKNYENDLLKAQGSLKEENKAEAQERIDLCEKKIDQIKYAIEQNQYIVAKFEKDLRSEINKDTKSSIMGFIKNLWSPFYSKELAYQTYIRCKMWSLNFAEHFDFLLLKHGINLFWYQKGTGVFLYKERYIGDLVKFFGSEKLLIKAIENAKPKLIDNENLLELEESPKIDNPSEINVVLPDTRIPKKAKSVFTKQALYFFKKAIASKYIHKISEEEYIWNEEEGGGNSGLVYFLMRAYGTQKPPYKKMGEMFGINNLTQSKQNIINTQWYKDETTRRSGKSTKYSQLKDPPTWYVELSKFCDEIADEVDTSLRN